MKNHLIAILNLIVVIVLLVVGSLYARAVDKNYLHVQQEMFVSNVDNSAKMLNGYFLREQQLIDSWVSYISSRGCSIDEAFEVIRNSTGDESYSVHLIWLDDFSGYTTRPSLAKPDDYKITYNVKSTTNTSGDYIITHLDYENELATSKIHMLPGFPDVATGVRVVGFYQKVKLFDEGKTREALIVRYLEVDSIAEKWNLSPSVEGAYYAIIEDSGIYISRPVQMKNSSFYEFVFSYNGEKYGTSQIEELIASKTSGSFTALDKNSRDTFYAWSTVEMGSSNVIVICALETTGFQKDDDNGLVYIIGGALLVLLFLNIVYFTLMSRKLNVALTAAEESNSAKTMFLNSMSHDIRTPLNAIIGYTRLAKDHDDTPEEVKTYLSKIDTSSNHLLSLINDVLDMSRIESGNVKLNIAETNLPDVIEELKTILVSATTEKKQKLEFNVNDLIHENVYADKLRLNKLLLNFLSNAVKYTPEGGKISFSLCEKKCERAGYSTYEFRIKDNGIGMSSEYQQHIFETFTREYTTTVNKIQGTGLGMAIAKHLADMMEGTISVESEQGKGSEFTVSIPFETCTNTASAKNNEETEINADFNGKKVLLVEDNEYNREIASEILEEAGFIITSVEDGDEAIEAVRRSKPGDFDLILMDIQMPKVDGYTATREIRTLPGGIGSNIPIIAMTANAFEEDRRKAIEAGMNEHIAKPIKIPVLMNVLAKTLNNYEGL